VIFERGLVVVDSLNPNLIKETIRRAVERIEGSTWGEVAQKLERIGQYEFEDYG
jgi:hypothetical protein